MCLKISNGVASDNRYDTGVSRSANDVNGGPAEAGPSLNPNGSADVGNPELQPQFVFDRAENAAKARVVLAEKGGFGNADGKALAIAEGDANAINEALYFADWTLENLGVAIREGADRRELKKALSAAHKEQIRLAATFKRTGEKLADEKRAGEERAGEKLAGEKLAGENRRVTQLDALMVRSFKRAQVLEKLLGRISSIWKRKRTDATNFLQSQMSGKGALDIADVLDGEFVEGIRTKGDTNKSALQRILKKTGQKGAFDKFRTLLSGKLPQTDKPPREALKSLSEEMGNLEDRIRPKPKALTRNRADANTLFLHDLADKIGEVRIGLCARIALCEQVDRIFSPTGKSTSNVETDPLATAFKGLGKLRDEINLAVMTGDTATWESAWEMAQGCTEDLRTNFGKIMTEVAGSGLSQGEQSAVCEFMAKTVPQLSHFVSILRHVPEVSLEDVVRIENGSYDIVDYVMTLAMGLRPDDMAPKREFKSVEPLGKGAASQTFLCTGKTGEKEVKIVFKPELTSFYGVQFGVVGHHSQSGVDGFATATAVNMVMKDIAMAGGPSVGSVIVDTKVGCVNKQYGMLMEYSPGIGMNKLLESMERVADDKEEYDKITLGEGGATLGQIRNLSNPKKQELLAKIAQQMNRLQWLDALTGQLDRHGDNYLLYVSPDLKTVEVKGIDNDAAFPTSVTRPGEFTLSQKDYGEFIEKARSYFKAPKEKFAQTLTALNGINVIGVVEKGSYRINFKLLPPAFKLAFIDVSGIKNPSIPTWIDKQMLNLIERFNTEAGLKEYKEILKRRNLSGEQIAAAVTRLENLRDIAKSKVLINDGEKPENDDEQTWTTLMQALTGVPPQDVSSVRSDESYAGLTRYVSADYFRQGAMVHLFKLLEEKDEGVQQPFANDMPMDNPFAVGSMNANPFAVGSMNDNPFAVGNVNDNPFAVGNMNDNPFAVGSMNDNPFAVGSMNENPFSGGNVNDNPFADGNANEDLVPVFDEICENYKTPSRQEEDESLVRMDV